MLDKLYITPKQWMHILRWSLYALVFLTALLLQTAVLGNTTVFGVQLTFVPLVIACVCLREGAERGGWFALCASLIWCLSGEQYGYVSLLILTALPMCFALLCRVLLHSRFPVCVGFCLLTLLADQTVIFLLNRVFHGVEASAFWRILVPSVVLSMLFQPLIYWLVRIISTVGEPYEST